MIIKTAATGTYVPGMPPITKHASKREVIFGWYTDITTLYLLFAIHSLGGVFWASCKYHRCDRYLTCTPVCYDGGFDGIWCTDDDRCMNLNVRKKHMKLKQRSQGNIAKLSLAGVSYIITVCILHNVMCPLCLYASRREEEGIQCVFI